MYALDQTLDAGNLLALYGYTPTKMPVFREIRRRKVFQVAVAYVAGAYLIVEVVNNLFPQNIADRIRPMTLVILAVGLPVALTLSWVFDWTPRGIVRDIGEASPRRASARDAGSQSLTEIVAGGPLSATRLLRIASGMARALDAAHDDGRICGVLTPDDFLIGIDDEIELREQTSKQGPTRAKASASSAYLAPECVRGDPADVRSDQFSLGALYYEMATGRRAFVGANREETLAAVVHNAPDPVGRFNPEAPMPFQWAIERCLAKKPDDRYPTIRELRDDLEAIATSLSEAISARLAPKHNLPAARTQLIGRETDIEDLRRLVTASDNRLVTISGAGGIGKTRLLIELGRELVDTFKGGVYFVPLDRVQDPDLVLSEIANQMGVQRVAEHSLVESLTNHVRQYCIAPTLLLLDNFEHVLDAAPSASDLLEASEQLKIVVTSRAALKVYGEREYRLDPLSLADRDASLERLGESPAVRLFRDRASALPKDLKTEELRIIADICTRLDGLPLAIELAAARTKVLSLANLRERIAEPLTFLSGGARDLPARQRTLRATLEWSFQLLNSDQQRLFRRFGVFVGGATLEAIEAVCNVDEDLEGDLVDTVESLVDSNLIRPMDQSRAEPRFAMLETMREYALIQLAESGDEARTRRAHAAYHVLLAEDSTQVQVTGQWEPLYERFDRERGNIRGALDWLIERRNGDWGLRLAQALGHYWLQRAHASEGYERMLKLLPLVEEGSEQQMWAYSWAGDLAANMGMDRKAKDYHAKSLELARKFGVTPAILRALNGLAVNTQQLGEMDESAARHAEAVRIAREHGASPALLGGMLSNSADNAIQRGDLDLAERLHRETLEVFIDAGDEIAQAWSLNRLGDVARLRGDYDSARASYEQSLAKFREKGDKVGAAGSLYDFATLALESGRCDEANRLNLEALSIYRELAHVADCPRVIDALARCALEAGDPARSLILSGGASAMRQSLSLGMSESARETAANRINSARSQLPDSTATESWLSGWRMSPDQAVAFALGEPL